MALSARIFSNFAVRSRPCARTPPYMNFKENSTDTVPPTVRLTMRKDEKLRHKSLVDPLFREGKGFYAFPLRAQVRVVAEETLKTGFRTGVPDKIAPLQMMITVPKKKRKRAVDRVLMRRRIREAYRLRRRPLLEMAASCRDIGTVSVAFIYLGDENLAYAAVERSMKKLLGKIGVFLTENATLDRQEKEGVDTDGKEESRQ